jgi:hypothetical protein
VKNTNGDGVIDDSAARQKDSTRGPTNPTLYFVAGSCASPSHLHWPVNVSGRAPHCDHP